MSAQPEALKLADAIDGWSISETCAATELRRLHEVNQELLEALQYFMPFIDSEQDDERQAPWVEKARAAIAKATGKTK